MAKPKVLKPIIKWVGGKTQIIDKVLSHFPKEIDTYHEIFLGGGSVLLGLLSNSEVKKVFAYDVNEALIGMYINIQKRPKKLYSVLKEIIDQFESCEGKEVNRKPVNLEEAMTSQESYYYWTREQYNTMNSKNSCLASAFFIFLNKTCFRGVYRVGPNGFNVPFGHYKNPEIINKSHLMDISELIADVKFICCDFSKSLENIIKEGKKGDFVYLDPPYVPEKTTSFVGYTENGFNLEQHLKLFKMVCKLKVKFLMSNSNVKLVRDSMGKFILEEIECKRTINSKNPNSKTKELLIKN